MLQGPGPGLDLEVARKLGDRTSAPLPYSSDAGAADLLISRLEKIGLLVTFEQAEHLWHCSVATLISGSRERLATGSGPTRAVSLCRAVMNLPFEILNLRS